ncbi:hypothetical protein PAESOLCIP111_04765 [Paenibacillus solanacearum]|uniref:Radical SAM protein n=1 Tax=Paenibacillus solanacearum TaxID=2048548 RepID=A0A916NKU7_9BACL|nr:hypothetical protein [Paenibacillus solanacearum]CAG7644666.1 hypothetical protein PAESOLCIP111_04765 [Paenibacillus solanacearum]
MECISSQPWLQKITSKDKVLLINPPIQEVRYAWIRWNQPTDLLLLCSKLKNEAGCKVELLDFMLPTESGRVPMRDLAKAKEVRTKNIKTTYKARTYGMPLEEATQQLTSIIPNWSPTHIVITTMTTYWFETLRPVISYMKTICPSAQVSIMGAYPVHETDHAMRMNADYLITDYFDTAEYCPDFEVYSGEITKFLHNGRTLLFGGLRLSDNSANTIEQIKSLRRQNIRDFVFFESNIFREDCKPLLEMLNALEKEKLSINLHGLCGLEIRNATEGIYTKMLQVGYRSFFLEYDLDNNELNIDSYRKAYLELVKHNTGRISSGNLAGFIMIGTADDELERLFRHTLNLLEMCGSIIPKPFTPMINSEKYVEVKQKQGLDKLTPHVFPLAVDNGITREEYMEFYQHTSFLNEKRLGQSFDFFDNHYCSVALKRSLGKKGMMV